MSEETARRRAGRPRDASVDKAILRAARKRLSLAGYEHMTIEDVAKDAGVSRPAVYRRWASKEELVIAAIASMISPTRHDPTGDVRADLLDIARSLQDRFLRTNYLGVLGTVLAERRHHPELYQKYQEGLIHPRRESIREVLHAGVRSGQLPEDVDVEMVVAMMVGSFYALALAGDFNPGDDFPERVVGTLMRAMQAEFVR